MRYPVDDRQPVEASKMGIKDYIKKLMRNHGLAVFRLPSGAEIYESDGLASMHDHSFLDDPRFRAAYQRGVAAGGNIAWHWRVHIGLWAARTAANLDGDFVECGVNRGFLSSSIMKYLEWDTLGKTFYLLDTFEGIDPNQTTEQVERERNTKHIEEGFYVTDLEAVKKNFAEWKNVKLIKGVVPDTLSEIDSEKLVYLHIDMNHAAPEVAALRMLWPRMAKAGIVLLDDYAYFGYRPQKEAMDALGQELGFAVASLPTGQGLIIRT